MKCRISREIYCLTILITNQFYENPKELFSSLKRQHITIHYIPDFFIVLLIEIRIY